MANSLVLDLSALSATDTVKIDTRNRQIYVNDLATMSTYASGELGLVLRGNGATTVAWTNTTNISSNQFEYRESDYI